MKAPTHLPIKKKNHDVAALMHAPARLTEKIIKLSCHLFVMILSSLTYLHIKALIKFSKESNAHFKTHSKASALVLFLISDVFL